MKKLIIDQSKKDDRIERFEKILDLLPQIERMADVGAGHCKFSIVASKRGIFVTAIDVRNERIPQNLEKQDIRFINTDINSPDFNPTGYDLICILGLLYHLSLDEQIALLKKCNYTTTIIDTHYSPQAKDKIRNYSGRVVIEDREVRKDARSAWTSSNTFWHTLDSLEMLFYNCGYTDITKLEPELHQYRSFFICKPS